MSSPKGLDRNWFEEAYIVFSYQLEASKAIAGGKQSGQAELMYNIHSVRLKARIEPTHHHQARRPYLGR